MEQSLNHLEQGLAAMKAGDVEAAVPALEEAARQNQTDHRVFSYLGAAYAAQGRYEKAIGAFKTAEQIAPGIARIHYNVAQAYEAVGIHAEAEYEYEKALAIDPSYSKAADALAALRARLSQS